jgi:cell division protein FtsZ
MSEQGKAMMGTATANGPDPAHRLPSKLWLVHCLKVLIVQQVQKVFLVLITAAKGGLKLAESREAMNTIRAFASPEAHVIYRETADDESLGDQIRADSGGKQGWHKLGKRIAPPLTVIQRTGTDNVGYAPQALIPGNAVADVHAAATSAPVNATTSDYGNVNVNVPSVCGGTRDRNRKLPPRLTLCLQVAVEN